MVENFSIPGARGVCSVHLYASGYKVCINRVNVEDSLREYSRGNGSNYRYITVKVGIITIKRVHHGKLLQ